MAFSFSLPEKTELLRRGTSVSCCLMNWRPWVIARICPCLIPLSPQLLLKAWGESRLVSMSVFERLDNLYVLLSLCDFYKNKQEQVWAQYRKARKRVSGTFCLSEPAFQLSTLCFPRARVSLELRVSSLRLLLNLPSSISGNLKFAFQWRDQHPDIQQFGWEQSLGVRKEKDFHGPVGRREIQLWHLDLV